MQNIFADFKASAERKKVIYDADIEALCEAQINDGPALWTLHAFTCNAGSGTIPSAALCLWRRHGEFHRDANPVDGPIHAVVQCIERINGLIVQLHPFEPRSVLTGADP